MSRIGKLPVPIPKGVEIVLSGDILSVKGPKGTLSTPVHPALVYEMTPEAVTVTRANETRLAREQHGLRRTLLANCVDGVTKGYSKTLEVIGVGYKVAVQGKSIVLTVGFSHPVEFVLPAGLDAKVEGNKLILAGIDKELLGETAARIRRVRPPEPFKGKGIKYDTEVIRRKAGKSGGKKK